MTYPVSRVDRHEPLNLLIVVLVLATVVVVLTAPPLIWLGAGSSRVQPYAAPAGLS